MSIVVFDRFIIDFVWRYSVSFDPREQIKQAKGVPQSLTLR